MKNNVMIFDYDGVLIDSFDIFMKNFIYACKKEGFTDINSKEHFLKIFDGNMYETMFNMGMNKEQILRIVYYMRDKLLEKQDEISFFPEIKETIEKLSENNVLVVVTSNDTKVVKEFLKSRNVFCFDEIIGSDEEPSKIAKINKVKKKYSDVNNFFYIGDTIGDIFEGKKADVKTVAVSWGWHSKDKLMNVNPDFFVDKPQDLQSILTKKL